MAGGARQRPYARLRSAGLASEAVGVVGRRYARPCVGYAGIGSGGGCALVAVVDVGREAGRVVGAVLCSSHAGVAVVGARETDEARRRGAVSVEDVVRGETRSSARARHLWRLPPYRPHIQGTRPIRVAGRPSGQAGRSVVGRRAKRPRGAPRALRLARVAAGSRRARRWRVARKLDSVVSVSVGLLPKYAKVRRNCKGARRGAILGARLAVRLVVRSSQGTLGGCFRSCWGKSCFRGENGCFLRLRSPIVQTTGCGTFGIWSLALFGYA